MKKRFFCLMLAFLLISSMSFAENSLSIPSSYLFNHFKSVEAAPPALILSKTYFAKDLDGVDSLSNMRDACVAQERVYLLCADKLLVFDSDFRLLHEQKEYQESGQTVPFNDMTGLTVTKQGDIYICSQASGQILHFDKGFSLLRILEKPDIKGFENVSYKPSKIAVDVAGRIYVIAKGMYEGIVELNPDGNFSRFFGVNNVHFTPWDYFWRLFATKEQKARQVLWLPTDFTNLDIDSRGFIFATIQTDKDKLIKRLNNRGENILVSKNNNYPSGDEHFNISGVGIPTGKSLFVAVDSNDIGMFTCLDQKRGRVFTYNEDGSLLYILGGLGQRNGTFRNPIDVDFFGKGIMVLDSLAQCINIYMPTDYGDAIHLASLYQYQFDYENAKHYWNECLKYNHNFTLAYSGIGRALLREGDWEAALQYLKMGEDKDYYSKAFEKLRNKTLKENFVPIVVVFFSLITLKKLAKYILKRRKEAIQ